MVKRINQINNIGLREPVCLRIFFQLHNIHIDDIMDVARVGRVFAVLDIEVLLGK